MLSCVCFQVQEEQLDDLVLQSRQYASKQHSFFNISLLSIYISSLFMSIFYFLARICSSEVEKLLKSGGIAPEPKCQAMCVDGD